MSTFYKVENDSVKIHILVKPNASKSAVLGVVEQRLCVAVSAKPHKGAANIALVQFLADYLNVPKSNIRVVKGVNSRYKQVEIKLSHVIVELLKVIENST